MKTRMFKTLTVLFLGFSMVSFATNPEHQKKNETPHSKIEEEKKLLHF